MLACPRMTLLLALLAGLGCHPPVAPGTTTTTAAPPPSKPRPSKPLHADARAVFEQADVIDVYALAPAPIETREDYESIAAWMGAEQQAGRLDLAPEGLFPGPDSGYAILAQRTLTEPDEHRRVLEALEHDLADAGEMADCFNPREAVQARRGEEVVTIIICYECGLASLTVGGSGKILAIGGGELADLLLEWGVPRCRRARKDAFVCANPDD